MPFIQVGSLQIARSNKSKALISILDNKFLSHKKMMLSDQLFSQLHESLIGFLHSICMFRSIYEDRWIALRLY